MRYCVPVGVQEGDGKTSSDELTREELLSQHTKLKRRLRDLQSRYAGLLRPHGLAGSCSSRDVIHYGGSVAGSRPHDVRDVRG